MGQETTRGRTGKKTSSIVSLMTIHLSAGNLLQAYISTPFSSVVILTHVISIPVRGRRFIDHKNYFGPRATPCWSLAPDFPQEGRFASVAFSIPPRAANRRLPLSLIHGLSRIVQQIYERAPSYIIWVGGSAALAYGSIARADALTKAEDFSHRP